MSVTIDIPSDIQRQLEQVWRGNLPEKILEAVALEGYRQGALSRGQVSELLGLSFAETEQLLRDHNALGSATVDEITRQTDTLNSLPK